MDDVAAPRLHRDRTVAVGFGTLVTAVVPYMLIRVFAERGRQSGFLEWFEDEGAYYFLLAALTLQYGIRAFYNYRNELRQRAEAPEEEKSGSATNSATGVTLDEERGDSGTPEPAAEPPAPPENEAVPEPAPTKKVRLYFLDNVKVFLTWLVLLHHVVVAFTGCGGWALNVQICSIGSNAWLVVAPLFLAYNQSYFMSLFFFISAYFSPSSYQRKGHDLFFVDKAQRLLIPLYAGTFLIYPATTAVALAEKGLPFQYEPSPSVLWFVAWLLVFHWAYASVQRAVDQDAPQDARVPNPSTTIPFPSQIWRSMFGYIICGLLMWAFVQLVGNSFYSMPIQFGSFICNVSFFLLGILAKRHHWLDPSSASSVMQRVYGPVLYACTLVDLILLGVASNYAYLYESNYLTLIVYVASGGFCVNAATSLLFFSYHHFNSINSFGKALSGAAYGVYILHPLVVVGITAIWAEVWNSQSENPIPNGTESFVGALIVFVVSSLIVWPLAYVLRMLPLLRDIL